MGLLKKIKHKTHHATHPSIPTPHLDVPHINPPKVLAAMSIPTPHFTQPNIDLPKVPNVIIKTPEPIKYGAKVVKQTVDQTITETKSETLTIVDAIKSTAVKLVDKVSGDKKEHSDEIIEPTASNNNWLLYGAIGVVGLMIIY
jgi:hypothetical protein